MGKLKVPKDLPKIGVIELDHQPTGKRYYEATNNPEKSINAILVQLESGKASEALQRLYKHENDFRVRVIPATNLREAKSLTKTLKRSLQEHLVIV